MKTRFLLGGAWHVSCLAIAAGFPVQALAGELQGRQAATDPRDATSISSSSGDGGAAGPVVGSTEASPGSNTAESGADIIVTAQRRSERLQDVPISITAFDAGALDDRNLDNVTDLAGVVPGLTFSGYAGTNATALLSLRGVPGTALPIGASQAVAVYIDGVFLSKPDSGFFGLDDIERVEVLRGPQGTLYGRNATAGAINIITRVPDDTFQGGVNLSYGNYNSYVARGSVSGPLGGGFYAGVSAAATGNDGYFINSVTGNRMPGDESRTGRVTLRYDNDAGFEAILTGDYGDREAGASFTQTTLDARGRPTFPTKFLGTDLEDVVGTDVQTGGAALTMNIDVSPSFAVTSITSWRKFNYRTVFDVDGSEAAFLTVSASNENETFNQELRGIYTSDRLRATFGVNYYRESGTFMQTIGPQHVTFPQLRGRPAPRDETSLDAYAGYAQLEFDLTDTLTAVAGIRVNHESRDFSIDYSAVATTTPVVRGKISDTVVLPSFGLNFAPTTDALLYAKYSVGYLAPGFNSTPGANSPANTFGAEKLNAYEIGAKTQFFDRAVTLNGALFYYDYSDLQVRTLISSTAFQVLNAASAKVKGGEVELTLRPVKGLTLNGHVTYSKATYLDFCEPVSPTIPYNGSLPCITDRGLPGADRSGNSIPLAPRWTGGLGALYKVPLSDQLGLALNVNYSWESQSYYTAPNETLLATGGWHRLDARAGLEFDNGLEVYAFGRNLTDDRHVGYTARITPALVNATISEPRTYGIGLRYSF